MQTRRTPFGKLIRDKRVLAELSLREVAARLEITPVYLGEIERGKRAPLKRKYWAVLIDTVPGLTTEALEEAAAKSGRIDIAVEDAPSEVHGLALALYRRAASLSPAQKRELMRLLEPEDDD